MSIRDTTYYGWKDILDTSRYSVPFNNSVPPSACSNFYIWDFAVSPLTSSLMYAVGSCTRLVSSAKWTTFRSDDSGQNWSIVDIDPGNAEYSFATGLDFDLSGNVYVCGTATHGSQRKFTVRKSLTGLSGTWTTIDSYFPNNEYGIAGAASSPACFDIVVNRLSGSVYICGGMDGDDGGWLVRYSPDGSSGSFSNIFGYYHAGGADHIPYTIGLVKSANAEVLLIGGLSGSNNSVIFSSSVSIPAVHSGNIKLLSASRDGEGFRDFAISGSTVYAVYGGTSIEGGFDYRLLKSTNSGSTWSQFDVIFNALTGANESMGLSVAVNPDGSSVYSSGYIQPSGKRGAFFLRRSDNGSAFSEIFQGDSVANLGSTINKIFIDSNDFIYLCGISKGTPNDVEYNQGSTANASVKGFVSRGVRAANSSSLGPRMLATSFNYVRAELSGTTYDQYKLNNVSEFPHAGGFFQMPNMVLGTKTAGKIGDSDDNIIQVKHIGSVVEVMWPKQDSLTRPIKGFGDFSAGERSGKLSTTFQPGKSVDVTEFDHMSLYCYLSKEVSGTLDDIIITVERKPLTNAAFAVDQSIDYAISGSKTEGRLRDIEYKKEVDYGDLSINKIGFPLDVPLTNVKEVRVSARHKTGQSEENKNLIIWGRFIRSSKDTNET